MIRRTVQFITAIGMNSYFIGFLNGTIYKGNLKNICVPGLNCSSCPGAWGSCPLLMLQLSVAGIPAGRISLFIFGALFLFGLFMGRIACGWLCPFGLLQELLYKLPLPKVRLKERLKEKLKFLAYLKYVVLVVFIFLLPALAIIGVSQTAFCTYLCPVEVLEAYIPLMIVKPSILAATGWLFKWKALLLLVILVLSAVIFKPFCKYLCPLGAIYALFNPVSAYGYRIEKAKCTGCGQCQKKCKLDIPVFEKPNHQECMRCNECLVCPTKALTLKRPWANLRLSDGGSWKKKSG